MNIDKDMLIVHWINKCLFQIIYYYLIVIQIGI